MSEEPDQKEVLFLANSKRQQKKSKWSKYEGFETTVMYVQAAVAFTAKKKKVSFRLIWQI